VTATTSSSNNNNNNNKGTRHVFHADIDDLNDRYVRDQITSAGNKPGNYRIVPNRGEPIEINNYSPINGSYGLTIRGFKTTIKPTSGQIDTLIKDGVNLGLSDTDFYDKYKSIMLIL
jgi:hypothetical protein